MANHIHRQIREAAATALTGLTTTASRVYVNRLYPIPESGLPALRISLDNESVEALSIHQPLMLAREAILSVECCAAAGDTVDDSCDQISKEVEIALSAGITVSGKTLNPLLTASAYTDEPGGLDAAVKRLDFRITFETLNTAPDALI